MQRNEVITNPLKNIVPPKVKRNAPEILSSKEVNLLLSQPKSVDPKGYRDRAMLEVLYATGMRVSELVTLNINDINLSSCFIRCSGSHKERIIPLYPACVRAVADYINYARSQLIQSPNETALFVNVNGKRMTRQGFWKIVKRYQETAGIEKDNIELICIHLLKTVPTFAPSRKCSDMLTYLQQFYSNIVNQRIREVYNKYHPRAN